MRKMLGAVLGLALAVAASPAMAAEIGNLSGQSCGDAIGDWHFVQNNIPKGYGPGTLTATIGGATCTATGNPVGGGQTQHFNCNDFSGQLTAASTTIPGKLVLSDFTCETSKCTPDPKGEICGDKIDNDCDGKIDEDCTKP